MAPVSTGRRAGRRRPAIRLRATFPCFAICVEIDSSADAPSSRAALPAPLPSSLAARPTRSTTSSRTLVRSTCLRSGTTRHPLGHFFRGLVLGRLHEVPVAQDADEPAVLGDRKPADLLAFHDLRGLLDVVIGADDRDLATHQVLRRFASRVMPLRDAANHDIAIGDYADQRATVLEHGDEPGVFL